MKKTWCLLLAALSLTLLGCKREELPDVGADKSIVILSDNDVH